MMEKIHLSSVDLVSVPSKEHAPTAPAIVVCPGGAYATRSRFEAEPIAEYFAAHGFNCYVCEYGVLEEARMPSPVDQLAEAVAYARRSARFVAVCGFSAGGHLCAMLCTNWREASARLGLPPESVRPDAAILCYAITYFPAEMPLQPWEHFASVSGESNEKVVPDFFQGAVRETADGKQLDFESMDYPLLLGTTHPSAEALRSISPAELVDDDTPPAFLWADSTDELVPCVHSERYASALRAHSIRTALHLFSQGGHGEDLAIHNPESKLWPILALDWLHSLIAVGA